MNKDLGRQILYLKGQGYSYNRIVKELGCVKSTVAYHCGTGQKAKWQATALLRQDKKKVSDRTHRRVLLELSWRYKKLCGCKHCGEKDPIVLQYDHKDRSNKLTTVSQMIADRFAISMVKTEIRKCDVLCANCHARKTAKELNYYTLY